MKKAMSSPSESRNDQCIGNLCVDKIQSPRIRDLCVDKTQSAQICNLCVEKNPRPRRARTNSRARTFLIGKSTNGRFSNKKNARPNSCAEQKKKQDPKKQKKKQDPKKTERVTKLTPADFCAERDPARPRLPQHYPAGDS